MNINNYTIKSQEALQQAVELTRRHGQQAIEPQHLLKAVMDQGESLTDFLFAKMGLNKGSIATAVDKLIEPSHQRRRDRSYVKTRNDTRLLYQKACDYSGQSVQTGIQIRYKSKILIFFLRSEHNSVVIEEKICHRIQRINRKYRPCRVVFEISECGIKQTSRNQYEVGQRTDDKPEPRISFFLLPASAFRAELQKTARHPESAYSQDKSHYTVGKSEGPVLGLCQYPRYARVSCEVKNLVEKARAEYVCHTVFVQPSQPLPVPVHFSSCFVSADLSPPRKA